MHRRPSAGAGRVAGEVVGGLGLQVTCMPGARGGFVLLVPSESERGVLIDMLAQNGVAGASTCAPSAWSRAPRGSRVGVGVGALALFGWVLSSIRVFFP